TWSWGNCAAISSRLSAHCPLMGSCTVTRSMGQFTTRAMRSAGLIACRASAEPSRGTSTRVVAFASVIGTPFAHRDHEAAGATGYDPRIDGYGRQALA